VLAHRERNGTRAYLANAGSGTVSSYNIGPGGRLHLRSDVAATVGVHPIDEVLGGGWFFVLTTSAIASAPVTSSGDLGSVNESAASGLPAAASGLRHRRGPRVGQAGGCNKPSFTKAGRHRAVRLLADFRRMGAVTITTPSSNPGPTQADAALTKTCPGFLRRPILVVEDDQTTCDVVRAYLESAGHRVVVCRSGSEALGVVRQTSRGA